MRDRGGAVNGSWFQVWLLVSVLIVSVIAILVGTTPAVAGDGSQNVSVYHIEAGSFETGEELETAIERGTVAPAEQVIMGDRLVIAIESPRLAERMANAPGSPTEQFFTTVEGTPSLRILQTNPTPQRNRKIVLLDPSVTTAYRQGTTTYLVVETRNLTVQYRTVNQTTDLAEGERFAVQFGFNLTHLPPPGEKPSASRFEVYPYKSRFVTHGYWYAPLAPDWVRLSVDVNVPPRDSLSVRLHPEDGETVTKRVAPTNVPGYNDVWLDLRDLRPGTTYTLELLQDGHVTDRYRGTIREPQAIVTNATLTEVVTRHRENGSMRTIEDHTAVAATVRLSHGGKVQVLDENCERLATRWVEPRKPTQMTFELWDHGKPVRAGAEQNASVLVRTMRDRGASESVYRNEEATATMHFSGSCPVPPPPTIPGAPSTLAPPERTTSTTAGTQATTSKQRRSESATASTSAPVTNPSESPSTNGQHGFTVLAAIVAGSIFALSLRRRS